MPHRLPELALLSDCSIDLSPKAIQNEDNKSNKERAKTTLACIILCLNLGIDPPGLTRPKIAPTMHGWITPPLIDKCDRTTDQVHQLHDLSANIRKSKIQQIGDAIQRQYLRLWQSKPKIKMLLDPTIENITSTLFSYIEPKFKLGNEGLPPDPQYSIDKNVKKITQRLLIHYNGQGMPPITVSGEIWGFSTNYTQYVPFQINKLVFDYQMIPLFLVADAPWAGRLVPHISSIIGVDFLFLGAGDGYPMLQGHPGMPADIFTAILTTPIESALQWYSIINSDFDKDAVPSKHLFEILTSITDTIAWDILPPDTFKQLFRSDIVIASLFRNFIFALYMFGWQGIGGSLGLPCSYPPLNSELIIRHPLWNTWENMIFSHQYPSTDSSSLIFPTECINTATDVCVLFFELQMHEFYNWMQVTLKERDWLLSEILFKTPAKLMQHGCIDALMHDKLLLGLEIDQKAPILVRRLANLRGSVSLSPLLLSFWIDPSSDYYNRRRGDLLPILLQALLSQSIRSRSLYLFAAYMQISTRCVQEALLVGIFPFISRLSIGSRSSQLPITERSLIAIIWSRIIRFNNFSFDDASTIVLFFERLSFNQKQFVDSKTTSYFTFEYALSHLYWIIMIFILNFNHDRTANKELLCWCKFHVVPHFHENLEYALKHTSMCRFILLWITFTSLTVSECLSCSDMIRQSLSSVTRLPWSPLFLAIIQNVRYIFELPEESEPRIDNEEYEDIPSFYCRFVGSLDDSISSLGATDESCPPFKPFRRSKIPAIEQVYSEDKTGISLLSFNSNIWTLINILSDVFFDHHITL